MEQARAAVDEKSGAQFGSTAAEPEANGSAGLGRAERRSAVESWRRDHMAGGMPIHGRDLSRRGRFARVSEMMDYVFSILYGLLAIRLVLALLSVDSSHGFVRLIHVATEPFYALFRGFVGSPSAEGFTLVVPILIAMAVYALLRATIEELLYMFLQQ